MYPELSLLIGGRILARTQQATGLSPRDVFGLATVHALSDESGKLDYDIEPAILNAIGPPTLFTENMVEFATESADRLHHDHEMFRENHARGAFTQLDIVHR
ncbi:hypothetical protein [Chromohalobacter sp. 296-RDG]|uniref:hypothetical protein n=1 Tax=Chromohalobacter sp. 296-RDG TaxID=2994062 RepID=UPI0024693825|nr:hypothetical protein [Chromohalobacter sp. 296-RDG]